MDGTSKKQLAIGVGVSVLLIAGAIYFYRQGKKTVTIQSLPNDLLQNGTQGISFDNASIEILVKAIHTDLTGINFLGDHDNSLYQNLLTYSDTSFTQFYNVYNQLYQDHDSETFTQALEKEFGTKSSPFGTVKYAILDRAAKLNLQ